MAKEKENKTTITTETKEEQAKKTPFVVDTEVVYTKENPYHTTGEKGKYPKHMAEHLVKKGYATLAMILLAFTFAFSNADAQVMSPVAGATVISTATANFQIRPTSALKTAIFQYVATRVSAAMGGSVFFYGSNDGTNWVQLTEAIHPAVTNDTLTISNAATSTGFSAILPVEGCGFQHYRVAVKGASSDTMTVKCYFWGRP